jgi:hypothetical protein
MAAKHIHIARDFGVEKGFDAFMAAPSSRLSENYKAIARKRTPATKLQAYCDIFAEKIASVRPKKAAVQTTTTTDSAPKERDDLLAAVLALLTEGGVEVEMDVPEIVQTIDVDSLAISDEFITADMAWDALGRGTKRPNDGSAPATNGQLWRLNNEGRLNLA